MGGYYGILDDDNHNLYEEIAQLGVLAESIQTALGDTLPGEYASAVAPPELAVNQNLLGYCPLGIRRTEAKNFFLNLGITQDEFAQNPNNTGFNFDLIYSISDWLGTKTTFKNEKIHFENFPSEGGQAQAVISHPVVDNAINVRNCMGHIVGTALMRDNKTTFGIAQFTLFQMMKEPVINPLHHAAINARAWCCVDFTQANPTPEAWIANRNIRRNIPAEYNARRFETISVNNGNLRKSTVRAMVIIDR